MFKMIAACAKSLFVKNPISASAIKRATKGGLERHQAAMKVALQAAKQEEATQARQKATEGVIAACEAITTPKP